MLALRAALAAVLAFGGACGGSDLAPGTPAHLVIVSFDTLRRDHLPLYGYDRDTAPALSAFAERAVVFEWAFAQDTNTNPSHTSMLTGLYPHQHGNLANGYLLRSGVTTLAEVLRGAGFATAAFVSSTSMLAATTGLERGFDVYDDRFDASRQPGRVAVGRAVDWLGGWRLPSREFLFVHLFDAHGPYEPEAEFYERYSSSDPGEWLERIPDYQKQHGPDGEVRRDLSWYRDRYDETIAQVDAGFGRLLQEVDLDDTVVIVVADHGESLGERFRKLDHGAQVVDEQIRIPLLIHAPGLAPARVRAPVETVDLLPTVLELLGVPTEGRLDVSGRSLVPLLRGGGLDGERMVFSSARASQDRYLDTDWLLDERKRIHSVRSPRFKLVVVPGLQRDYRVLYDLSTDPGETRDVSEEHPEAAEALHEVLRRWRAGSATGTRAPLSPELRERLRSLGYAD